MNRFFRFTATVGAVLFVVAMCATPVLAQAKAPDTLTYVAEWTIPRDQWAGYAEWTAKNHKPILERLAAEGTLVDWGIYETYVHEETSNTHGAWWSATSYANIEKARTALMKAGFHPAAMTGTHHDYLMRSSTGGTHAGATAGGFLSVNRQEIRPGQGKDWKEMWEKYRKPVLDELVAQGALASYAIQVEDVHTASNAYRYLVTVSTSPEAEDQIDAAWSAAGDKLSEAEQAALGRVNRELTVPESHRDYLAKITAAWFK
jgi:hypothetical protein